MIKLINNIKGDTARYLMSGAFVTIAGTLLLTLLLKFISYPLAFTVCFVMSVLANMFLHSFFVFRKSLKGRFHFAAASLILQYFIGLGSLHLLLDIFHVPRDIAPIFNLFICTPINFIMSRMVFRHGDNGDINAAIL